MDEIIIKRMELSHVDDVMVVENLCFSIPWSKEAFIQEVTENRFAIYIVALYQNTAVGYAGMWKVFDEGHITNVAVHPEFRRYKIGSRLLENLIQIAKDEGITGMTLEVRKSNFPAQLLYSKYGFKPAGIRKNYYADTGEDAVIMWKEDIQEK